MRNQQLIKTFLILMISTVFIFGFSHLGVFAYHYMTNGVVYEKGTKVASIDIEGMTEDTASVLLQSHMDNFKGATKFKLSYDQKTVELSNDIFQFDMNSTLSSIKQGSESTIVVTINEALLEQNIKDASGLKMADLEANQLKAALLDKASILQTGTFDYSLDKYVKNGGSNKKTISKASIVAKDNEIELKRLTSQLNILELKQGETFSLLALLAEKKVTKISEQSLGMLATIMYETVLPTNFSIEDRNISSELPSYAELGYEAKVSIDDQLDFSFINPNESTYKMYFEWDNNKLIVSLKGNVLSDKYKMVTKNKKTFKPKTIKQFDANLQTGKVNVTQAGQAGSTIDIFREITTSNGKTTEEKIASDYYAPVYRIEVHPLKDSTATTDTNSTENTSSNNETTNNEDKQPVNIIVIDGRDDSTVDDDTPVVDDEEEEEVPPNVYYDEDGNVIKTPLPTEDTEVNTEE